MPQIGPMLRKWRTVRRLSQMQLALDAEMSARHISFVETGRSHPSREVLLVLASQLEVPLRDRNAMLLAAGYAPAYHETDYEAEAMKPARQALELILKHHEPFPAIVIDRAGDIRSKNEAATLLTALTCANSEAVLRDGPPNLYRVLLHPEGIRHCLENWEEVAALVLYRAEREASTEHNRALTEVLEQVRKYPDIPTPDFDPEQVPPLVLPLRFHLQDRSVEFISTIATLGTATDVTLMELRIETWFAANAESAAAWSDLVREQQS